MILKYAIYGLCFGWLLMPRWKVKHLKAPVAVTAYAAAVIACLFITYFLDYTKQAWLFVIGMALQLLIAAAAKWVRYFILSFERNSKQ